MSNTSALVDTAGIMTFKVIFFSVSFSTHHAGSCECLSQQMDVEEAPLESAIVLSTASLTGITSSV